MIEQDHLSIKVNNSHEGSGERKFIFCSSTKSSNRLEIKNDDKLENTQEQHSCRFYPLYNALADMEVVDNLINTSELVNELPPVQEFVNEILVRMKEE